MDNQSPPAHLRQIAAELAEAKPMRRGSESERMVKCNKPNCPCGKAPAARHGPYFSLTRAVAGKTHSRFLTQEQANVARRQIQAGQEFRVALEKYWEGCEAWADSQSEASPTGSAEEAEKGGFKPTSNTKSSRKSRRP